MTNERENLNHLRSSVSFKNPKPLIDSGLSSIWTTVEAYVLFLVLLALQLATANPLFPINSTQQSSIDESAILRTLRMNALQVCSFYLIDKSGNTMTGEMFRINYIFKMKCPFFKLYVLEIISHHAVLVFPICWEHIIEQKRTIKRKSRHDHLELFLLFLVVRKSRTPSSGISCYLIVFSILLLHINTPWIFKGKQCNMIKYRKTEFE